MGFIDRRRRHHAEAGAERDLTRWERFAGFLLTKQQLRFAPAMPLRWRRRYTYRGTAWDRAAWTALAEGEIAIGRDVAKEDAIAQEDPLRDFRMINEGPIRVLRSYLWESMLPFAPQLARLRRHEAREGAPVPRQPSTTPAELTERVREWAREAGLSEIGITSYDDRYTFAEWKGARWYPKVIVCVLEQDYEKTQQIPSVDAERAAFAAYTELFVRSSRFADRLRAEGFNAEAHDHGGRGIQIHYAVAAGLGQLGLNGQLLTPVAGSRCRLALLTTDAPLEDDVPRDFGIERVCDSCQICVRRCPVGAIPNRRADHRGVMKAKINTQRCFPVVARAKGCAICMKVCPVQRYGLDAVKRHLDEHGEVLGKGTDDLEGYTWPLDGRFYGPSQRPKDARVLPRDSQLQVTLRAVDGAAVQDGTESRDSGLV